MKNSIHDKTQKSVFIFQQIVNFSTDLKCHYLLTHKLIVLRRKIINNPSIEIVK